MYYAKTMLILSNVLFALSLASMLFLGQHELSAMAMVLSFILSFLAVILGDIAIFAFDDFKFKHHRRWLVGPGMGMLLSAGALFNLITSASGNEEIGGTCAGIYLVIMAAAAILTIYFRKRRIEKAQQFAKKQYRPVVSTPKATQDEILLRLYKGENKMAILVKRSESYLIRYVQFTSNGQKRHRDYVVHKDNFVMTLNELGISPPCDHESIDILTSAGLMIQE